MAQRHNDSRSTVLRTVYIVKIPRLWSCGGQGTARTEQRVVHPLSKRLRQVEDGLCRQRPPFPVSQTQIRKTKVWGLNDGPAIVNGLVSGAGLRRPYFYIPK